MSDTEAPSRQVEYCCPTCLWSVMAADTAKPPHCPRGHGRMEADDVSLPPARLTPAQAHAAGRTKGRVKAA